MKCVRDETGLGDEWFAEVEARRKVWDLNGVEGWKNECS